MGLSIGVACCLLLALYIRDEARYDKHHVDLNNLYRITTHIAGDQGLSNMGSCSPPIAPAMEAEIPEVEVATRLLNPPGVSHSLIRYEDNIFYEADGFVADSTVFDIFTFTFLEGHPKKALVNANSVVIINTLAKKLFGSEPALNKSIYIDQGGASDNFVVTGVIGEEKKSHVRVNFLVSMTSSGWAEYIRSDEASGEWAGQNFMPSYVKLTPGHSKDEVVRKMNQVLQRYGAEDLEAMGFSKTLGLDPVKDIYLKSDIGQSPRITYLYVILSIAVFILLIACINFMNLSTAKASKRASEIGIRKVMGAFRSSLVRQLLGETMVIVFVSMLMSVVLTQLALPYFNQVTGKEISFGTQNIIYFIGALAAITIVTGIIAGSYPAFYLSSFQPAHVLKGKFNMSNTAGWLRRGLVVFQFMVAITLVCGMAIILKQLKYIQEKELGFESEAKLVFPIRTDEAHNQYEALKQTLGSHASVKKISGASYMPGMPILTDLLLYPEGGTMETAVRIFRNRVDENYVELLGIKMITGRTFINNRAAESDRKIIINRTGIERLGYTLDDAVGRSIYGDWQGEKYTYEITGVMEDFHQVSLKETISPTIFMMPEEIRNYDYMIADVDAANLQETLAALEKDWRGLVNNTPFEFNFLDERISKQYEGDRKVSKIITTFTIIAMLISCLGLYGLSTYMAERRFKEIGIRKVMGASVRQIVRLMSSEFVQLVIIAFVVAVPLSYYAMTKWLEGFAYKVPVDVMVFAYAGIAALLIALLTVSLESIKAASGNPVNALRNE
jgi:putative ABC transport system permease protein